MTIQTRSIVTINNFISNMNTSNNIINTCNPKTQYNTKIELITKMYIYILQMLPILFKCNTNYKLYLYYLTLINKSFEINEQYISGILYTDNNTNTNSIKKLIIQIHNFINYFKFKMNLFIPNIKYNTELNNANINMSLWI
jgi:hypothetical protein